MLAAAPPDAGIASSSYAARPPRGSARATTDLLAPTRGGKTDLANEVAVCATCHALVHAGLLREHLPLLASRVAGIVSRGGALLAKWMLHHNKQNPLYEMFEELCDILAEDDVCFSLGDGLRPGHQPVVDGPLVELVLEIDAVSQAGVEAVVVCTPHPAPAAPAI